jgi:hypothetical protein
MHNYHFSKDLFVVMTNLFGNHILLSSIKVLHQLAYLKVVFTLITSDCLHMIQVHLQVVIPPHGSHESTINRFLGNFLIFFFNVYYPSQTKALNRRIILK